LLQALDALFVVAIKHFPALTKEHARMLNKLKTILNIEDRKPQTAGRIIYLPNGQQYKVVGEIDD